MMKDKWKLEIAGHEEIWTLHKRLREEIKRRWNRSLPFADEFCDRWERAAFLGFGEDASIYDSSLVIGDVTVGEGTWIGPFTVLDGSGGLIIGRFCSISSGVQLYSHDTVEWALTGGKAPASYQPTRIGDCCYIGPLSVISMGVSVGDHCVVGAESFVHRDVPPYSIVAGCPARVIGRVEISSDHRIHLEYTEK